MDKSGNTQSHLQYQFISIAIIELEVNENCIVNIMWCFTSF